MVLIGALLMVAGLVLLVAQPLRQGQLSRGRDEAAEAATLEPETPNRRMGFRVSRPGAAIFGVGVVLMLIPAVF